MSRKRSGARVLGPYADRQWWRVISVASNGDRETATFESEQKATRYKELLLASLSTVEHTTETAFELYVDHLRAEQLKPATIGTERAIVAAFFPEPILLTSLTPKRCKAIYDEYRARPLKRTGKAPSVDTHRNALARMKTFLRWCANPMQGWLTDNPLETVKGVGKRRPRGKSLGKSGAELHVKEARLWYTKAIELASAGDQGAIAALVALLLGMRASEIVDRKARDLDSDQADGDLLWIEDAKTEKGRRQIEVPEVLRPFLLACADGKAPDRYLFTRTCGRNADRPHMRNWVRGQVRRVCRAAGVAEVTAHAMRGLLATITAERGMAGALIAATLGHTSFEHMTARAYARPGSAAAGTRRRGWSVLDGGLAAAK